MFIIEVVVEGVVLERCFSFFVLPIYIHNYNKILNIIGIKTLDCADEPNKMDTKCIN